MTTELNNLRLTNQTQTLQICHRHGKISEFSPESKDQRIKKWLDNIERFKILYSWNDQSTSQKVLEALKLPELKMVTAKKPMADMIKMSWNDLKALLSKLFIIPQHRLQDLNYPI